MPWTGESFASKHNHALHGAKADHAARIANAVMRSGTPEGESIAIANRWAQRRDDGGGIVDNSAGGTSGGIGGITPSVQSMNPFVQSAIQKYAAMPTEKLAELVARLGPTAQGQTAQKVLQQKRAMPQPEQQSQGLKRGGAAKRAAGGMMSLSQGSPWWTRAEARGADSGFLHGSTPGRADSVRTTAPGGAYVVPADVVAGLGEGNSLAGARIADAMFSTGPHGIPMPKGGGRGNTIPRPPPGFREEAKAGGPVKLFKGGPEKGTPVLLSHGEYVVSPEMCRQIGTIKGKEDEDPQVQLKRGHRILDAWIVQKRKEIIDKMKKLPGPVKT